MRTRVYVDGFNLLASNRCRCQPPAANDGKYSDEGT